MKYISTRNSSESLPFESVFIKGLADDGGLFLPEKDYKFDEKDLSKLQSMSCLLYTSPSPRDRG